MTGRVIIMKRRNFLKWSMGTGLLATFGVPLLTACSGVKRSDFPASEEPVEGIDEESARILWYASLAPSSHNSQPWFVKVLGKGERIMQGASRKGRWSVTESRHTGIRRSKNWPDGSGSAMRMPE
jgi:hypothetical protein